MTPLLLLIDLQHDYLAAPDLEPAAPQVVERAARLLTACRSRSIPVVHAWTTVCPDPDRRMPHWQEAGTWRCVEGSPGHGVPERLAPWASEPVVHKTHFSAFSTGRLDPILNVHGADTLILAGLHLHACVAKSALDAYERGLRVVVADDATGSYDPLHAAVTRRYLSERTVRFLSVAETIAGLERSSFGAGSRALRLRSPRDPEVELEAVPVAGRDEVARALAEAGRARTAWAGTPPARRAEPFLRLADRLEADAADLARRMAVEVGKPVTLGEGEVRATAAMLRALVRRVAEKASPEAEGAVRRRPLGVVAIITPWNNPLYIPLGKVVPALLYGNAVVWKPAPAGAAMADRILARLGETGLPDALVGVVHGDRSTAELLMAHDAVDGVSITGSSSAGYAAQALCARRRVPLQAELGGNNAAVVWADADLAAAAREVAFGAFAMAGQRCTANRRVVVHDACYGDFLGTLEDATRRLVWGDPLEPDTLVGPLVSAEHRARIAALVGRAEAVSGEPRVPHAYEAAFASLARRGTYYPPTIVCCDDPSHEIVQEESFGPVLVVQRAVGWDEALRLANGVRQGLAAALFSTSSELQDRFLAGAQAGILKLNRTTAGAEIDLPFGGWKVSGLGPPEHGAGDRAFYTRVQTVYR